MEKASVRVVKVFLVEDEPEVREVQRRLVEKDPRLTVIGEAASGEEALDVLGSMIPDVVTMDLLMPGMDGLEATRRIKNRYPDVKVVVVSAYGGDYLARSVQAGADGYVLKIFAATTLVERLLQVTVLPPRYTSVHYPSTVLAG
jgi:DNA-binding NarL/FixJ family response regulator